MNKELRIPIHKPNIIKYVGCKVRDFRREAEERINRSYAIILSKHIKAIDKKIAEENDN